MTGHLHPLIIRPITETALMAGDFMNSDASLSIIIYSNPLGFRMSLRRSNAKEEGSEDSTFSKIEKGREDIRGEMVH